MLDKHLVPHLVAPLNALARQLNARGVRADQVTWAGFVLGLACVVALAMNAFDLALGLLVANRVADGVDGALARMQTPTDAGAFLDICLDFVFYALFPIGFALADPANALAAAVLIASFVGTGASFLAFAKFAEARGIQHPNFAYKGLYYLNGLAEGTETIACFVLMCLLPQHFVLLAGIFATICLVTAVNRIVGGWRSLRD
ncbi:CDP-alcohol phosphatidyltransferase family protein [Litorivicinus lipolyticus]|uniref:CDP-alcohol phosphatidyltransferase family protein n=1 Tax=Litorivicinus lipolyticus TaxID=418701 RepID=UPI003B5B39E5